MGTTFGTKRQLPSGKWLARWLDHAGNRNAKTFVREAQCDSWLSRKQVERDEIVSGRKATPEQLTGRAPTMGAYLDNTFLPSLDQAGVYKWSERLTTKGIVKNHIRPRFESTRLDEITRSTGAAFRTELEQKGLGAKTVRNIVMLLTRILRDAEERGVIAQAPSFRPGRAARRARRQAQGAIPRTAYLDFDEYDRLVAQAEADHDPVMHAATLVAGRAGLRAGELRALKKGDLDFKTSMLSVSRNEYRGVYDVPKSGVSRQVPMSARVVDALKAIGAHSGDPLEFLFTNPRTNGPLTEQALTVRLLALGERAGIRGAVEARARMRTAQRVCRLRARVTAGEQLTDEEQAEIAAYDASDPPRFGWHMLRHTFCSHLAMRGTPLLKIKEWAGHSDVQTTQRYMHLAPAERHAAAALDALDVPAERHANVVPLRATR